MAISTDQYSVKALFEQKQTFVIPKYQRGYAWDDEAVNDFIEDISECWKSRSSRSEKHHFFGGVVTIRREVKDSTRDNYEVIDGQQRLASFVLLAGCIIQHIGKIISELQSKKNLDRNEKKAKNYLKETQSNVTRLYLTFRDNRGIEYTDVPKLILSNADNDFFQNIITGNTLAPNRESHKRILFAWESLSKFVQTRLLTHSLNASKKAQNIQQFLDEVLGKDCTAIFMCSNERSEAYQIFQVLNDRGVNLGKGDLLRARTLELLDDPGHQRTQAQVSENWDSVLAYTPREIDDFLLWYFSSMEGRRPKPVDLADEFLDYRFNCRDKNSVNSQNAKNILAEVKQLKTNFATLANINEGNWPWIEHKGVSAWDRERLRMVITHLKHTNAMPLLLSLMTLTPRRFANAVTCIERFVFRYKTIVNAHVTPMTNVYLKHAKIIRGSQPYSISSLRKDLSELILQRAPDSIFETSLREIKYLPGRSNTHIRYFFVTMEDYWMWYEDGAQGVPKCRDKTRFFDIDNLTVEHIYPQTPSANDRDDDLDIVKNTLGNLTILSSEWNDKLANKPVGKKLKAFAKSDLKLNREITSIHEWTAGNVEQRTKALAAAALKVFVP